MPREGSHERKYSYSDVKRLCAAVLAEERRREEASESSCRLACSPQHFVESFDALEKMFPHESDAEVTLAALAAFEAAFERFADAFAKKKGSSSDSVPVKEKLERVLLDTPKDWLGYAGPGDIYRRLQVAHGKPIASPDESAPLEERKRASLSLFLSAFSRMAKPQDQVDEEFQTVMEVIEAYKAYGEADKTLERLRALGASSAARRILAPVEGICLMHADEIQAAAELLEKSIEMGFDTNHLRNALGYCYWELRRNDDAALQFQRVLESSPDNDYALTQLIKFSVLEDRLEAGLAYSDRLVRINPESPAAWNLQARLLLYLDRTSEAEDATSRALALGPDNLDALLGLSQLNREKGHEAEAQECLRKALLLASGKAYELATVGNQLIEADMPEEALTAFEQAAELEPENAKYYLGGVAEAHYSLRDWRLAMETYEHVGALRPWSSEDAHQWANSCCELGEHDRAVRKFQDLLRENQEAAHLWGALGVVYLRSRQPAQALSALEECLKRYWDQPAAHFYTGMALLRLGNIEAGRQKLLDLEPLSELWTTRLAREIAVAEASPSDYLERHMVPVWFDEEDSGASDG